MIDLLSFPMHDPTENKKALTKSKGFFQVAVPGH